MPDEPEVMGLLALMLLIDARRAGADGSRRRAGAARGQDRARWDRVLIAEGQALVRRCLARNQPGRTRSRPPSTPCTATRRRGGHRLAADPAALRSADGRRARPGRRAQSRRGASPKSKDRTRRWPRRRARSRRLLPVSRDPRRPAAPSRPQQRGRAGVRRPRSPAPTTPASGTSSNSSGEPSASRAAGSVSVDLTIANVSVESPVAQPE